eukprot:CAMPEP_0167760150 /NCGR_PEP_ID=MMETSP0110_2-20121227/11428_1 /TAXON_ID=629695 /ORGANISM="Gymnochlora sp., Strain CCMP2014" /LENGTH=438 /DNA_ID=CAMNT_0007646633 /DNA_START=270 /DNA_END=1586 /DNA_ORIENTATION=+
MARFRSAIKSNLRFYAIAGVLLISFLIYVAVQEQMTGSKLLGFAICLSNTWGLTLYVLLLGYGLVEVPRSFWYESSLAKTLEFIYYKAAETHDGMELAADDLASIQTLTKGISRRLSNNYPYRRQLSMIEERLQVLEHVDLKMDGNLSDFSETALATELDDVKEPSLSQLVKLNKHVRRTIRKYFRLRDTMQDTAERGAWIESVIRRGQQPLPTLFSRGLSDVMPGLNLRWMLYCRQPVYRSIAFVLGGASLLMIWAQLTIPARMVSPMFAIYQAVNQSDSLVQIALIPPLTYLCGCAFWSMFQLQLFDYYLMDNKRRTGEVSLLFNGTYLLRIFAPIGFNFVSMLVDDDDATAFGRVMGDMEVVPFFGSAFNSYLPILISIFSLCTFFNVYYRLLKFLGIEQFSYSTTNDQDRLEEGKKHVAAFTSSVRDEMVDTFL